MSRVTFHVPRVVFCRVEIRHALAAFHGLRWSRALIRAADAVFATSCDRPASSSARARVLERAGPADPRALIRIAPGQALEHVADRGAAIRELVTSIVVRLMSHPYQDRSSAQ
jgi:hypothetical protein